MKHKILSNLYWNIVILKKIVIILVLCETDTGLNLEVERSFVLEAQSDTY